VATFDVRWTGIDPGPGGSSTPYPSSPSSAPACTSDQCRSRSIGLLEEQLSGRQSRLAVSPWLVPPRLKRKTEEVTSHKVLRELGADGCTYHSVPHPLYIYD
ncbi:hypothetical protein GOODEAATRI_005470, partial [Goodea atripinnis]